MQKIKRNKKGINDHEELEMTFDPKTIEHLGLKMYSTLPPALAEIISNAYDADASKVKIKLIERRGVPKGIKVIDNGDGLSYNEINDKFLVIGRNRRETGDTPSTKFHRRPT
jgi:signal transduction histidine kinase